MRLHRRQRKAGDVGVLDRRARRRSPRASPPSPVPRMIADVRTLAEARANDRRRALDRLDACATRARRIARDGADAVAASRSFLDERSHPGRRLAGAVARRRTSCTGRLLGRGDLGELALDAARGAARGTRGARDRATPSWSSMRRTSARASSSSRSASACASRMMSCAFLLRLLADLAAQLLRRDERLVDRLVALAERAQLLVEAARLRVEILIDARQPLELLGDLIAELVRRARDRSRAALCRTRSAERRAA